MNSEWEMGTIACLGMTQETEKKKVSDFLGFDPFTTLIQSQNWTSHVRIFCAFKKKEERLGDKWQTQGDIDIPFQHVVSYSSTSKGSCRNG